MLLTCLLDDSWVLLRRLGRLLGPLASLLGASWCILAASWQPLGGLLGLLASSLRLLAASWVPFGGLLGSLGGRLGLLASSLGLLGASWRPLGGLLGPLGWPGSGEVALARAGARFLKLPGGLLGGKMALARAGVGFSGGRWGGAQVRPGRGALEPFGTPPPLPKALAKAKATTIMSLLAN